MSRPRLKLAADRHLLHALHAFGLVCRRARLRAETAGEVAPRRPICHGWVLPTSRIAIGGQLR